MEETTGIFTRMLANISGLFAGARQLLNTEVGIGQRCPQCGARLIRILGTWMCSKDRDHMPHDNLCCAGDYRWYAATVTSMGTDGEGEAELHPVPAGGPKKIKFSVSMGGRVSWRPEEHRMVFSVCNIERPVPGSTQLGQIRVAFSDNKPGRKRAVGWVYGENYRVAQNDRLAGLEQEQS